MALDTNDKVTITVDGLKVLPPNILQVTLMIVWVEHTRQIGQLYLITQIIKQLASLQKRY